jgi:hypothetical protein
MENKQEKCQTCGKKAHNFEREEVFYCVPPKSILKFGPYKIDVDYRNALYNEFPFYTTEEIVGSFLGYNPNFPSQAIWLEEKEENIDEDDEDFDE